MKKIIANLLFISAITFAFLYGVISVAVETTGIQTETVGAWMTIAPTPGAPEAKAFVRGHAAHDEIPVISHFPITGDVFNSSVDFFCAQHSVPYGRSNKDTYVGNATGSANGHGYHNNIEVGKNRVTTSKQPDADIDASAYYYVDKDLAFHEKTPPKSQFYGFHDKGETPKDTAYTNWVYKKNEVTFGCPNGCENAGQAEKEKVELAFLMAAYKAASPDRTTQNGMDGINNTYARGSYSSDPLQSAVWSSWINIGSGATNKLANQAAAYWAYHEASANPNVDVDPDENVGTVLEGGQYKVGPFHMSAYVRAANFTSGRVNTTTGEAVVPGEDEEEVATGNPNDAYEHGQETLQDIFGDAADRQGTIIKAIAVVTNESGALKEIEFKVPEPSEDFYLYFSETDISGFDELKEIRFVYQRVHVYGNGNVWRGEQKLLTFKQTGASRGGNEADGGCNSYNCVSCKHTGLSWDERSDAGKQHIYWCLGSGYCTHGYSGFHCSKCGGTSSGPNHCTGTLNAGYVPNPPGPNGESTGSHPTRHDHTSSCYCTNCSHPYCSHGYNGGKHSASNSWSKSSEPDDWCSGTTKCQHEHTSCYKFDWVREPGEPDKCQDGFEAAGDFSNEKRRYDIIVKVPLKTNMKIYKYITKVEHHGEGGRAVTVDDRSGDKTVDWKRQNSVKVERGDHIEYTIKLKNASRFPTAVQVKDTLPDNIEDLTIDSRFEYKGLSGAMNPADWIEVPAKDEVTIIMYLDPLAYTGTHENKVEFITTNSGQIHMRFVHWGDDATHGPRDYEHGNKTTNIVNEDESRITDSDFYTIKEYDLTLDKYITEVKHETNNVVTYSGTERKQIDQEENKKNDPVYAEFGDVVTYKIDIYNTKDPYLNAGSKNRDKEPFWDPDLAYVDITDKLPNKYSKLNVEVSNGTGTITTTNGGFKIDNIQVPFNGITTVTVKIVVEEHDKTKLEENNAKITPGTEVRNVNHKGIINHSAKTSTSDWYHINDYDLIIDKYISDYKHEMTDFNNSNNFTNETNTLADRYKMTEDEKKKAPMQAEKNETVIYSIRLTNEAVEKGKKRATQVRPTKIQDAMDMGLEYQSVAVNVYRADGSVKFANVPVTHADIGNNTHTFEMGNKYGNEYLILDPTDYIIYEVTVKVTKTNMYLYSLENTASMLILTNINNDELSREVKNDEYDENITKQDESKEYVKLKDLVIAGKVWLDRDKDGYMGQNGNGNLEVGGNAINVEANPSTHIEDTTGKEYAMQGIIVRLYKDDGSLVRTTKTDSTGLFTFGRMEDGATYYAGNYLASGSGVVESEQRIDKATNKDPNKNYTELSELINYYIEYEYDGLVYKSTEIYSDNKNIGVEGEIDDKYKRDSNAYEFQDVREEFNTHYEIIAFNKAYNGTLNEENALEYEKKNHESFIRVNKDRKITARSFINVPSNKSIQNTKLLWLYKLTSSDYKPETEYLKYINLGLEEREDVDLDITQDVYELKTAINGEEMLYEYNQNKFTSGKGETGSEPKAIDKAHSTDEYNSEFYMTGYSNDTSGVESNRKLYSFEYYLEDYNYRISQYHIDTVRAYKGSPDRDFDAPAIDGGESIILDNSVGRESELNTEITFRIKVTNNSITDDEPHKDNSDIKVYTGINEIVEYYDTDFVNLTFNGDGSIKGFNIKTKDDNGYLINKEIKVLEAKAVMDNGQEKPVILSKTSAYNDTRTLTHEGTALYDTLYIRPAVENTKTNTLTNQGIKASEFILGEGESMDILIKFVVEKEVEEAGSKEIATILGMKENVAEISSYSTYYKDGENYKSASLIDKDSNPGNFGEVYEGVSNVNSPEYIRFFEDDTFKTGILLKVPTTPPPPPPPPPGEETIYKYNVQRTLEGYVWDDARSNTAVDEKGTQYIGNGKYGDGVSALAEARKNRAFEQADGSNKEDNDFAAKDVKAQLIETIRMPDPDVSGGERVYEDTIYVNGETGDNASVMKTRTGDNGKYRFNGYIPGEYIVRFTYGDKETGEDVNALCDERFIFNGQDYKSTTYQADETTFAENAQANGDKTPGDVKLETLEKPGQSDAKDDEIRRLEVIGYSETMTNQKNDVLKGKDTSNKEALLGNTYMNSETTDFLVRPEKEIKKVTKLTYQEYNKKITEIITSSRFKIANIDFGLQYRPEQQLALNKFISNITVLTSDTNNENSNEPLVDAIFDEYYGVVRNTDFITGAVTFITDAEGNAIKVNPNGSNTDIEKAISDAGGNIGNAQKNNDGTYVVAVAGTMLNRDKSVGLQNVQYLPNEYEKDANGIQAIEEYPRGSGQYLIKATQGFAYIVLDDDILQGATIKVKYLFTGTNISEVDRVSSNLSDIRFKENEETEKYAKLGGAQNTFYDEVAYQLSNINNKPTFLKENYSPAITARNAMFSEYYRYELQGSEIRKDLTNKDILYRVKPKELPITGDKVVTIADIQKSPNAGNPHSGTTGYYGRYLGSTYYTGKINADMDVIAELKVDKVLDYIDNDLVFNNDDNKGTNNLWKTTTTKELYEGNMLSKFTYTFFDTSGKVSSTTTEDMKLVDADGRAYDTAERSNLAISLDDRVRDDLPEDQDTTVNKDFSKFLFPRYADSDRSIGIISLATSKVLSPQDKTDDMTYENIAEIIQYTSVTGRVTNLATTIGNAKIEEISDESPEFHEGRTESDTASVEKVTLTPPPGLSRINRAVRNVVEKASYTVVIVIVVIAVCVGVAVGITLYHKRRIK